MLEKGGGMKVCFKSGFLAFHMLPGIDLGDGCIGQVPRLTMRVFKYRAWPRPDILYMVASDVSAYVSLDGSTAGSSIT